MQPLSLTQPPKTLTAKGGPDTRERILAVALQLFSEKGFCGASTREIARRADLSEVTLFRHFPTKELLLEEVINRYSVVVIQDMIPSVVDLPYEEGLSVLANQLLATLDGLLDWIRILHRELQQSPDKLHKVYHSFLDAIFDAYASYFRAMQQRGALRSFDPELAARAFHGIFFNFFNVEEILQRKHYRPTDRDKAISEFVRIFAFGTVHGKSTGSETAHSIRKGGMVKQETAGRKLKNAI